MKLVITENQLRGIVEMSIRAHHGGHRDFDKFETDKIGTGESTQIYGWGLYFSDRESVAHSYAISVPDAKNLELKYNPELKYKGKIIKNLNFIIGITRDFYKGVGYFYGDGNFIKDTLYDNVVKNLHITILNYLRGKYGDNSRWEDYIPTKQRLVNLVKNKYEEFLNNIENNLDYEINDTYNSDDGEINRLREKLDKEKKRYEDFINGRLTEENKIIDVISNLKREDFSLTSDDDLQKHGYVYDVTLHKNKTPDQYDYLSWPDYLTSNQKQKIINQIKTEKLKKRNFYIANPGVESTVQPAFFHSYEQAKDWVKQQNIKNSTGFGISMFNYTVEKGTFTKEDLNKTVGEFYIQLSGLLGSQKNASMFLLRAGIDGIKNFDTHVVFDPNAVTIEKKNKVDL
jgi:hypothetical protein